MAGRRSLRGATLALCYTLAHPDRVTGLPYLSGPRLEGTATTRDRVRATRLARPTEAERARLLAAEHRLADDGDDEDAAATIARLLWLTDFADRSSAPDFIAEPLFAHPRNAEAAAALNQDRARWLADPTLRRRLRRLEVPTLVVHGGRDPLPADGATEVAQLLPLRALGGPARGRPHALARGRRDGPSSVTALHQGHMRRACGPSA